MALYHRKLIRGLDPINSTVPELCEPVCDPAKNQQRLCPIPQCSSACPSICLPPPPPPPPPVPYPPLASKQSKISFPLKVSVSVLVTLFFLFLIYTLYKFCTILNRSRRERDGGGSNRETLDDDGGGGFVDEDQWTVVDHPIWYIRTVGLPPSVIEAITVVKYKKFQGLVEGTDCSVCLSEFQEDETLRLLPKCNHAFHVPCIDTWLRSHINCPMCRAGIANPPASSPGLDQVSQETQVREQGNGQESAETQIDSRAPELRAVEAEVENDNCKEEMGNCDNSLRRSASYDSFSGSRIEAAIVKADCRVLFGCNSGTRLVKMDHPNPVILTDRVNADQSSVGVVCSSSNGRLLSMKRSVSCSGEVLFSGESS